MDISNIKLKWLIQNCNLYELHAGNGDFLQVMDMLFNVSKYFGIPNKHEGSLFVWCILLLIGVSCIEFYAIYKLLRIMMGTIASTSKNRSVLSLFSGSVFYGNALLSTIILWRLRVQWPEIQDHWRSAGHFVSPIPHRRSNLKKTLLILIYTVAFCSVAEHILSMVSAVDIGSTFQEYFRLYILSSHAFIVQPDEYTPWTAIPIFVLSKTATAIWNYQDLIIIIISMGIIDRYKELNTYTKCIIHDYNLYHEKNHVNFIEIEKWKKLRESYLKQGNLVHAFSKKLSALVTLSTLNNLYFICLQLFLGVGNANASIFNKLYYMISFGWLCIRACSVMLFAAEINVRSNQALVTLHSCPDKARNVEIQRLMSQMKNEYIVLGGFGLFYLQRSSLLKVIAAVITYELVLLQYDRN